MRNLGAACALLAAAALAPASFSAPAGRAAPFVGEGVEARLAAEGRVGVLVSREGGEMERAPSGLRVSRTMDGGRILAGSLDASGLAALSRDPNVRAIVLDRRLRPAGQVGTAQVGADRLQAAGVTGTGRTIGIIDTGIDLYHPDLGASASGGGRIVGGWSFADDNGDLFDCDGHGTAVAGVAAGSQGIAPDASIVALKVFGARDGCTSALASDVLAAVEWALDRRRELGIEVLNVSLSDDRVRPGFCDAEDPVSASVFARARAEGVSVVAASGNTGRADGVSWPACHADVVSVGMVYSVGQGPTSWDGEAGCADPYTGPDVVPCASNGGPALSLLAPGVRWSAPMAGGGRRTTFTGTSAAAPAAAASLLLARQLSPYGDPALAADFLRLTGVPVTDGRSGASTPRVDVGSAYVAPSAFSGPCASAPGEPSALVCRATVSSLVGEVASAAVALSAECPRLAGLRASLTAPDGATVVLVDGVSRGGTAFREVLGPARARRIGIHDQRGLDELRPVLPGPVRLGEARAAVEEEPALGAHPGRIDHRDAVLRRQSGDETAALLGLRRHGPGRRPPRRHPASEVARARGGVEDERRALPRQVADGIRRVGHRRVAEARVRPEVLADADPDAMAGERDQGLDLEGRLEPARLVEDVVLRQGPLADHMAPGAALAPPELVPEAARGRGRGGAEEERNRAAEGGQAPGLRLDAGPEAGLPEPVLGQVARHREFRGQHQLGPLPHGVRVGRLDPPGVAFRIPEAGVQLEEGDDHGSRVSPTSAPSCASRPPAAFRTAGPPPGR